MKTVIILVTVRSMGQVKPPKTVWLKLSTQRFSYSMEPMVVKSNNLLKDDLGTAIQTKWMRMTVNVTITWTTQIFVRQQHRLKKARKRVSITVMVLGAITVALIKELTSPRLISFTAR